LPVNALPFCAEPIVIVENQEDPANIISDHFVLTAAKVDLSEKSRRAIGWQRWALDAQRHRRLM